MSDHPVPKDTPPSSWQVMVRIRQIPELLSTLLPGWDIQAYQTRPQIAFGPGDFAFSFLNPDEIMRLNRFKALKKQVEWLCGRYTAKTLAREALVPDQDLDKIRIAYMDEGAPYLEQFPDLCLTLSHSGIYTAAAVALTPKKRLGIDIEALRKRPGRHFMKIAFTEREARHMGPSERDLFCSWTLKEAYLKYIRKGFNQSLLHVEIIDTQIFHSGKNMNLWCQCRDLDQGYILGLVCDPGARITGQSWSNI